MSSLPDRRPSSGDLILPGLTVVAVACHSALDLRIGGLRQRVRLAVLLVLQLLRECFVKLDVRPIRQGELHLQETRVETFRGYAATRFRLRRKELAQVARPDLAALKAVVHPSIAVEVTPSELDVLQVNIGEQRLLEVALIEAHVDEGAVLKAGILKHTLVELDVLVEADRVLLLEAGSEADFDVVVFDGRLGTNLISRAILINE